MVISWFLLLHCALNISLGMNMGEGIYGTAGLQYKDGGNALIYYDAPMDANDDTQPLQATIDEINNIYYYLTDNKKNIEWYPVLIPFNLTDPTNKMEIIELPFCWTAAGDNDIGEQIASNPYTGDVYLLCHSKKNFKNESDLYKLIWNNKANTMNFTLIEKYNVGDSATDNFIYPTIFDSKRNTLWAIESYYSQNLNGSYMNNFDVINGSILNQIPIIEWKLLTGIYNNGMDKIISMNFTEIRTSDNKNYMEMNVIYSDPITAKIVENIGKVNVSNYYCKYYPVVYTMDIKNNIWYQMMYRRPDNQMCTSNNPVLYGDILTINITNALLINVASGVCKNDYTTFDITCPVSIEYWNFK